MLVCNIKGISFSQFNGENINGKVLIFLPGIGVVKENYILHLKSFISHYSQIYSIDLPEQGSNGSWCIGEMVNNLKIFINYIDNPNIKTIHLAGHSAGAVAIISFLLNYNVKVEQALSKLNNHIENFKEIIKEAKNLGFLKPIPETTKIEVLFLYSPPISFNNLLINKIANLTIIKNQILFKFILNFFVNIPMVIFKLFTSKRFVNFNLEKSNKPQYFNFVMKNHTRFLEYTKDYQTVFELSNNTIYNLHHDISELFIDKRILIQYGQIDWLLKFFLRRKNTLTNYYSISPKVDIIKHSYLGHFLRKKFHLDINLNNQMITNKSVIFKSINYILN